MKLALHHHDDVLWMWLPILLFVLLCVVLASAVWNPTTGPVIEQWPTFPLAPVPFGP